MIGDLLKDDQKKKRLAKMIVLHGFRNTFLEDLHAGRVPYSEFEDKRDVVVISPNCPDQYKKYKEIKWEHLSRLDDKEMKKLMIECVNNVYTILDNLTSPVFCRNLDEVLGETDLCPDWNEPKLNIKSNHSRLYETTSHKETS